LERMFHNLGNLVIGAVFTASVSMATLGAGAASAESNFLKADGIYLRDQGGKGDTAWLYGVNFGGLFVHEPWMSPLLGANTEWDSRTALINRFGAVQAQKLLDTYWDSWATAADFRNMAADGLNCVRMPVYFLDYMDDNGVWRKDSTGAIDFRRIDRLVRDAGAAGVYTLIDLHGAPGSQNGNQHSGKTTGSNLYTTTRYQEMFVQFWDGMATHFKDSPFIAGYDLLNEPSQNFPAAMGQNVVDLYDRAYKAIRKVDTNHVVIMEAIWAWNLLPDPKTKGWNNVSYSLHYYKWEQNNDYNVMKTFFDGKVADAKKFTLQYNVPHLAGEFTLFGNAQVWDYWMPKLTQENWHWTIWSYKVTGTNSSWGLYTANNPGPNTPNVQTDSYDQILQKWGKWSTTANFTRNPMVGDALKKASALRKTVRPKATPVSARPRDIRDGISAFAIAAHPPLLLGGREFRVALSQAGPWKAAIQSLQGRTVLRSEGQGTSVGLAVSGLEAGIYTAVLESQGHTQTFRFVLQR
jgi:endoglucanase